MTKAAREKKRSSRAGDGICWPPSGSQLLQGVGQRRVKSFPAASSLWPALVSESAGRQPASSGLCTRSTRDLVKKYRKSFFPADLQYQEELNKDVECSLPIRAVPIGLRTAPKTFLELLRPNWVALPEWQCGAAGTM